MNKLHHVSVFVFIAIIVSTSACSMEPDQVAVTLECAIAKKIMELSYRKLTHYEIQHKEELRSQLLMLEESVRKKKCYDAARYDTADIFKVWLSTCGPAALYKCDPNNNSLMHLVCGSPDSGEKIRHLIAMRANIDEPNKQGQTPLEYAQQLGDVSAEKLIGHSMLFKNCIFTRKFRS